VTAVRSNIGAIYVDDLRYDTVVGQITTINRVPDNTETDVALTSAISLQIVSLLDIVLNPVTTVTITRSSIGTPELAYDAAAGGFQTGYTGTATPFSSPGATVDDELWLTIQPTTPFSSLETVTIAVAAAITGYPSFAYTYSFTAEDLTAPTISEILWITPKKARIKFSEVMDTDTTLFYERFVGNIETVNPCSISFRGSELDVDWEGYYAVLAGSFPFNNGFYKIPVSGVNTGTSSISLTGAVFDDDDGKDYDDNDYLVDERTLTLTISPYRLRYRSDQEGLTSSTYSADRYQCGYEAVPISIEAVPTDELPTGEDPDQYVYLNFNMPISVCRKYEIIATKVQDVWGNEAIDIGLVHTTPDFGIPDNRINMWSFGILPEPDKEQDLSEGTQQLRRMAIVLQDLLNTMWLTSDSIQYLKDPALCATNWLPHLLYNLGSPFQFPIGTEAKKRKLGGALPGFYKKVGTATGIEQMLHLLLGYNFIVGPYIAGTYWVLGDSVKGKLGFTTILGPTTDFARNSYTITSDTALTDTERRIVRDVANWADPINMHLVQIIEP